MRRFQHHGKSSPLGFKVIDPNRQAIAYVYAHADAEIAKGLTRYDALRFEGVATEVSVTSWDRMSRSGGRIRVFGGLDHGGQLGLDPLGVERQARKCRPSPGGALQH
jgi:hypothetical protein